VVEIGSVVEETIDDLQLSSLTSREKRSRAERLQASLSSSMSSPLVRASSTWAAVVAVKRSDILEDGFRVDGFDLIV